MNIDFDIDESERQLINLVLFKSKYYYQHDQEIFEFDLFKVRKLITVPDAESRGSVGRLACLNDELVSTNGIKLFAIRPENNSWVLRELPMRAADDNAEEMEPQQWRMVHSFCGRLVTIDTDDYDVTYVREYRGGAARTVYAGSDVHVRVMVGALIVLTASAIDTIVFDLTQTEAEIQPRFVALTAKSDLAAARYVRCASGRALEPELLADLVGDPVGFMTRQEEQFRLWALTNCAGMEVKSIADLTAVTKFGRSPLINSVFERAFTDIFGCDNDNIRRATYQMEKEWEDEPEGLLIEKEDED